MVGLSNKIILYIYNRRLIQFKKVNMKNFKQKIIGFTFILGTLICMPTTVIAAVFSDTTSNETLINKDDLIGGWEYTVAGAPEGYDAGLMMIVKAGDTYKVQVQLQGGAMNGTDVVAKGKDISFKLMIEGESVSVSLSVKGSKMTGTSTSSTGTYTITGVKSISPM